LGVMYEQGMGVEQDLEKAVGLFRAAHAAGDATATFNLGALYSADVDAQLGCVA